MLTNMEVDKFSKLHPKRNKVNKSKKIIKAIIFIILSILLFLYLFYFTKRLNTNYSKIINLNYYLIKKIQDLENIIKRQRPNPIISSELNSNSSKENSSNEEFDEILNKKYIENQIHFCQSDDLFYDTEIENKIKRVRAHLNNIAFYMFVYKSNDYVSDSISGSGAWEGIQVSKLIKSLNYYGEKKKLNKNEITVLDIGANVGWYSFYLANAGYELFSFEVSHINGYIIKKNFCLNQTLKITLINKGIGLQEEKCFLHHPSNNIGNAVVLCGENGNIAVKKENLTEEVEFTKLSNYYSFLSKKNLALIKLDVEGSEGKVIESGIEFISKYKVPFLFVEFRNDYLKLQGTDPKEFLEMFEKNGYLFSIDDFFCKKYLSIEVLLKVKSTDLFIIHKSILE